MSTRLASFPSGDSYGGRNGGILGGYELRCSTLLKQQVALRHRFPVNPCECVGGWLRGANIVP